MRVWLRGTVLGIFLLGIVSSALGSSSNRLSMNDIAQEVINRSGTSSQVLSLNVTNLIILLVLKGLLFGAAMIGSGGHQKARATEEPLMSEAEVMLLVSYLMGDASKDYSCLQRVACQEPRRTKRYLGAAKLLIKASKMFDNVVAFNPEYEELVANLQHAVNFGIKYNGACDQKYTCSDQIKTNT